jgi:hypothetical protein
LVLAFDLTAPHILHEIDGYTLFVSYSLYPQISINLFFINFDLVLFKIEFIIMVYFNYNMIYYII